MLLKCKFIQYSENMCIKSDLRVVVVAVFVFLFFHREIVDGQKKFEKLDQILLNGNNICMVKY
jgi:hypothetical protein